MRIVDSEFINDLAYYLEKDNIKKFFDVLKIR